VATGSRETDSLFQVHLFLRVVNITLHSASAFSFSSRFFMNRSCSSTGTTVVFFLPDRLNLKRSRAPSLISHRISWRSEEYIPYFLSSSLILMPGFSHSWLHVPFLFRRSQRLYFLPWFSISCSPRLWSRAHLDFLGGRSNQVSLRSA